MARRSSVTSVRAAQCRAVFGDLVEAHTTPASLGQVHGDVRRAHDADGVARPPALGGYGHPDAGPDVQQEPIDSERLHDRRRDLVRAFFHHQFVLGCDQQDPELVPSQAPTPFSVPRKLQPVRHLAHNGVACVMAKSVIDFFEAVQVYEHDRDLGGRPVPECDRPVRSAAASLSAKNTLFGRPVRVS